MHGITASACMQHYLHLPGSDQTPSSCLHSLHLILLLPGVPEQVQVLGQVQRGNQMDLQSQHTW